MELTPKQQATELLRQAQKVLIVTGREPNNDQLASMVALQLVLTKLGKEVHAVVTDKLPKSATILNTQGVATAVDGVRDFVITLDMDEVEVDKLKYTIENGVLNITVTPYKGNFKPEDAHFGYGAFQFDLVVALGVTSLSKIDRMHEQNPTMFDGLHLINIDYHRINDAFGSVNVLDANASSVAEMLISLIEALGQGMIDVEVATALLTGIMSATNRFTTASTTAKALTVAAQMMSVGAKQQEIVRVLFAPQPQEPKKPTPAPDANVKKKSLNPQTQTPQTNPQVVTDKQPPETASLPMNQFNPWMESSQDLSVDELTGNLAPSPKS